MGNLVLLTVGGVGGIAEYVDTPGGVLHRDRALTPPPDLVAITPASWGKESVNIL